MQPRLLKHPARLAGASLLRLQDDNRLVALAREGHDPAFAAIVDRYGPALQRYCARLLGPGRAEDAVQQAFVNAHAAMRATDQELALKPWLYRIAHNASLNILRASKGEETALDMEHAGAAQTADVVELREQLRETLASIQALPSAQRDALLLRELEGRSHEEIALALGITAGGARQHLHRARMSLRAAASAITPYPVLTRILNAAADGGARSADLVSGAGMGVGAGAVKATRDCSPPARSPAARSGSTSIGRIPSPLAGTAAARHTTGAHRAAAPAVKTSAQATTNRSAGHRSASGPVVSDDHGTSHRTPVSEFHRSGSSHDDGAEHEVEHHDGSGSSGGSTTTSKTTDDHSGPAAAGEATTRMTTTATSDDNSGPGSSSSGSGSDDGLSGGSSGPGGGETGDDHDIDDGRPLRLGQLGFGLGSGLSAPTTAARRRDG
jgi:RNA polymerase sigma factor (sigma-70 family)